MATGEEGNKTTEGSGETFVVQHLVHSRDHGVVKPIPSPALPFPIISLLSLGFLLTSLYYFPLFPLLFLFASGFLHL